MTESVGSGMENTMRNHAEDNEEENKQAPKFDLASIIDRMNEQQLIVALVAISPELDDILPDDPQLKRDVESARKKIADRQLSLTDDTKQVSQVVEQSVHIHLWDEQTSARVKELGAGVINLFQDIKEKLVEAKKKYIDGDDRNVISFEEAFSGFKDGLRDMVDFITRRDRPENSQAETPKLSRLEQLRASAHEAAAYGEVPQELQNAIRLEELQEQIHEAGAHGEVPDELLEERKALVAQQGLKPWHYVLGALGAVPSKELIESLHQDDEKPVMRLASSAVGDVLDDELQPTAAAKVDGAFVFGQDDDDEEGYDDDDELVAVSPEPVASPAPEGRKAAGDSNFYLTRRFSGSDEEEMEALIQHLEGQGIHPARIGVDKRPMSWNELTVECSSSLEAQDALGAIDSFYEGSAPALKQTEGKQLSLSAQALGM